MPLSQTPALLMLFGASLAILSRDSATAFRGGLAGSAAAGVVALIFAFGGSAGDALWIALTLLTLFVAAVTLAFSARHMRADPYGRAFAAQVSLLAASVLGFVSAHDLVVLALCWIASGVLLARLVGHARGWEEAIGARRRVLAAFTVGDGALVVAFALLARHADGTGLDAALAAAGTLPAWMATLIAALLLVAAAARCGLPPFSRWLLRSMAAPTPVSALMHAGLVNAGGFLLIRFAPVLEAAPAVRWAAVALGFVAALYGAAVMLVRPDVKRGLAASTVAQMGFMVLACGFGAYAAAAWHLVAHGLFKAWLFLGAGSVMGRSSAPALAPKPATVGGAALVAAALCIGALASGLTPVEFLPLLLAAATAVALGGAAIASPHRAALLPLVAVALTVNLGALALLSGAVGAATPLAGAPVIAAALLLFLLVFWIWQTRGRPLPPALYARLASI